MPPSGHLDCLLLIPTAKERTGLLSVAELRNVISLSGTVVELCGFGPIAAAARTAQLLAGGDYRRVVLAGIAGSYCGSLPIGSAFLPQQVGCWGVGAGSGAAFRIAPAIGFSQLSTEQPAPNARDLIDLDSPVPAPQGGLLLTCCAAAHSEDDCRQRLERFPEAVAEDMEGFGVALACRAAGLPLAIVRGISNRAGDRRVSGWAITPALVAAAHLVSDVLQAGSKGAP